MSPIVTVIVLATIFGVFSLYYYNRDESKNKKLFREAIGRNVFFITFVAPIVAAALFTLIISLVFRESENTGRITRGDAILISSLFYLYGVFSASMGMHALAKAFKDDVVRVRDVNLMKLIRFFHGPFSHVVSNVSFNVMLALLALYNVNHPLREQLLLWEAASVIVCGVILGIGLTIMYVLGNTTRLMKYVVVMLTFSLIYLENRSSGILWKSPLSLMVLAIYVSSLSVMLVDRFGPSRKWFHRLVERYLVTVDGDWRQVIGGENKRWQ